MTTSNASHPPAAVILAAGLGKRMQSDLPKVLHPVGDRPMVCAVIDACREAGCDRIILVVGYRQDLVREALADQPDLEYAVQQEQLGTGHAVAQTRPHFADHLAEATARDVFVLAGDGPLIRASTLRELLHRHRESGAGATMATSVIDDPTGYGRIVRDGQGAFTAIVEQKSCTPEQLAIREVNPSYYCFDSAALFGSLERVGRNEQSGEYYVTDVPGILLESGRRVEVIASVPPEDILSINSPEQLAEVDRLYRERAASHGGVS